MRDYGLITIENGGKCIFLNEDIDYDLEECEMNCPLELNINEEHIHEEDEEE